MNKFNLKETIEAECAEYIASLLAKYSFIDSVHLSAYADGALTKIQDMRKDLPIDRFVSVVQEHNTGVIKINEQILTEFRDKINALFEEKIKSDKEILEKAEAVYEAITSGEVPPAEVLVAIKKVKALFNERSNAKSATGTV